jgi:hypothetical protein
MGERAKKSSSEMHARAPSMSSAADSAVVVVVALAVMVMVEETTDGRNKARVRNTQVSRTEDDDGEREWERRFGVVLLSLF